MGTGIALDRIRKQNVEQRMKRAVAFLEGRIPSVCNPIWLMDPKSHVWVWILGWDHATNALGRGYEV